MSEATLILAAAPGRKTKPHREDLQPGEVLCAYCTAKCCRYFAVAIDTPNSWEDFDTVRWFLLHERAAAFVEDESWYLLVFTRCKHLREDNLCGIYACRPKICGDYGTENCEYEDSWVYDQYWETSEQIEEYAEAILGPRPGRGLRSARPACISAETPNLDSPHRD